MIDPVISLVIAASLSVILFTAAQHKFSDHLRFQAQLDAYGLLPAALLPVMARLLPWMEALIFVTLLLPSSRSTAAVMAAALFAVYAAAMAVNLLRGRHDIDCGCGGAPQALSWWLVLRNLVLAGFALVLVLPVAGRPPGWGDLVPFLLLTLLLAMLYQAVGQLVSNQSAMSKRKRSHG